MRSDSPIFYGLLNYRYQAKFQLLTSLTRAYAPQLSYPDQAIRVLSQFSDLYQKTLKEYSAADTETLARIVSTELDEPPELHDQKMKFLKMVAQELPDIGVDHTSQTAQIRLVAQNMLHREVYLGTPVLVDSDADRIMTRTDELLRTFDGQLALIAFLIASIGATYKAMANNNKLRSDFIPSTTEVRKIIDELADLNLSWLNAKIRKKMFYLRLKRDANEIPVRYFLLEISHLLFHLSLAADADKIAKEGLLEAANEVRSHCNTLSQDGFFKHYHLLRERFRGLAIAHRYYHPQKRPKEESLQI